MATTDTTQNITGQKTFSNLQLRLNSSGYADANRYLYAYSTDNLSLLRSNYKISDCLNSNVNISNMMTTNTTQTITAQKTFNSVIFGVSSGSGTTDRLCVCNPSSKQLYLHNTAISDVLNSNVSIPDTSGFVQKNTEQIAIGLGATNKTPASTYGFWEDIAIRRSAQSESQDCIAIGQGAYAGSRANVSIGHMAGRRIGTAYCISLACSYTDDAVTRGLHMRCRWESDLFRCLIGYENQHADANLSGGAGGTHLMVNRKVQAESYQTHSDISLKTNIEPLLIYNKMFNLNPVSYDLREHPNEKKQYGLIAQEVEKIIPDIVHGEEGSKSISYMSLIPFLIKCVQQQQAQIDELKKAVYGHITFEETATRSKEF